MTSKIGKSKKVSKHIYAKVKRSMAKTKKSKAKKNMDTFFFQAKTAATLIPKQGVSVANYVYQQIALMDSASAIGVTQIPEFVLYKNLYDQVRINSVTVKLIPKANVLDMFNAQQEDIMNVSGSGVYYHAIDRDGLAPSNVASILRYPSVRKTSVLKPSTRTYKVTWPSGMWLDCGQIYTDQENLRRQGCFGGITYYAENLYEESLELINEPWATLEITYNCVFRGKTSASLTVGDTGAVTIVPHDLITNLAPSDLLPLYGQVNLTTDNTGATVSLTDRGDHTVA